MYNLHTYQGPTEPLSLCMCGKLADSISCMYLQDIAFHILWILMWFIASVGWAVAFNRLDDRLDYYYNDLKSSNCNGTTDVSESDRDRIIYAQAQIAVVSSILCVFSSCLHDSVCFQPAELASILQYPACQLIVALCCVALLLTSQDLVYVM